MYKFENVVCYFGSLCEPGIYGGLVMDAGVKPRIARIYTNGLKGRKRSWGETQIVVSMVCEAADVAEKIGKRLGCGR